MSKSPEGPSFQSSDTSDSAGEWLQQHGYGQYETLNPANHDGEAGYERDTRFLYGQISEEPDGTLILEDTNAE